MLGGWTAARAGVLAVMLTACGPGQASTTGGGSATGGSAGSQGGSVSATGPATSGSATAGSATGGSATGTSSAETGLPPGACSPDDDLMVGACPSQGETCSHRDFECACLCNCDGGGDPGEPGRWNCFYDRFEELLVREDLTVTVDCMAGTVAIDGSFRLDNADGMDAVDLRLNGAPSIEFSILGPDTQRCTRDCQQSPCPMDQSFILAPGEVEPLGIVLPPAPCGQPEAQQILCDVCGTTAEVTVSLILQSAGFYDPQGVPFVGVPVVCN